MERESLVNRGEVTAMLFAIADMNDNIRSIRDLLEEEHGGEEDLSEDDA